MLQQQIVNGIALGSLYALIAVGFSLVFSILEIINFSHGSLVMAGVYVSLALGLAAPTLGFFGVALITILIMAIIGVGGASGSRAIAKQGSAPGVGIGQHVGCRHHARGACAVDLGEAMCALIRCLFPMACLR